MWTVVRLGLFKFHSANRNSAIFSSLKSIGFSIRVSRLAFLLPVSSTHRIEKHDIFVWDLGWIQRAQTKSLRVSNTINNVNLLIKAFVIYNIH